MFIETLEFTIPVDLCDLFSTLKRGPRSNLEFPASVNSYGTTQDASVQVVLRSNKLTFKVDGVSSDASIISKSESKTLKLSVFDVDRTLMPQENDNYNSNNMTISEMHHSTPVLNQFKRHHEVSVSQPPAKSIRTSYSESPRPRSPVHRRSQPHISPRQSPSIQSKSQQNDTPVNVKLEPEDPDLIEIEPDDIVPKKETPYMQIDYSSDVPHTQTSQAALDRLSHPQSSHSQSPGSSSSSFHQNVPHVPDFAEPSTSQARYGDQSADDFLVFQDENDDGDDNEADYSNDGSQPPYNLGIMTSDLQFSQSDSSLQWAMSTVPKKRKLEFKSLETKYFAIMMVERGEKSKAQIAREVGIPHNTLSTWMKNSQRIKLGYLESDFDHSRKRLRAASFEDVDHALLQWYREAVSCDRLLPWSEVLAKAEDIAVEMGHTQFTGSYGWVSRWIRRHGILLENEPNDFS